MNTRGLLFMMVVDPMAWPSVVVTGPLEKTCTPKLAVYALRDVLTPKFWWFAQLQNVLSVLARC